MLRNVKLLEFEPEDAHNGVKYSITVLTCERFMDIYANDLGIGRIKQLDNVIQKNKKKIEEFSLNQHYILNRISKKEINILSHYGYVELECTWTKEEKVPLRIICSPMIAIVLLKFNSKQTYIYSDLLEKVGADEYLIKACLMSLVTQNGYNLIKKEHSGSNLIVSTEKFCLNQNISVRG